MAKMHIVRIYNRKEFAVHSSLLLNTTYNEILGIVSGEDFEELELLKFTVTPDKFKGDEVFRIEWVFMTHDTELHHSDETLQRWHDKFDKQKELDKK